MIVTALDIARRYLGTRELAKGDHPLIQWWLSLCHLGLHSPDEIPWCSAFMQHAPFELGLPRSESAAARSWLKVGQPIDLIHARPGFDVVILTRAGAPRDPSILAAPGHVGWFVGHHKPGRPDDARVLLLGGNQTDAVSIAPFRYTDVIGTRRLLQEAA